MDEDIETASPDEKPKNKKGKYPVHATGVLVELSKPLLILLAGCRTGRCEREETQKTEIGEEVSGEEVSGEKTTQERIGRV